jgi:hypothetical protein
MDLSKRILGDMQSPSLQHNLNPMQKSLDCMSVANVSAVNLLTSCAICGADDHFAINCDWGKTSEGDVKQINALNNNNL